MFKKKYLLFFSLFILGVFLCTSCLPKPPITEGILKGQVMVPEGSLQAKELTGQALPDATVNIIDLATGEIIATTTTDANGYYQVFVPAGGPYLLEAIKDGIKVQQFTPQVEVGIEYDLGTADCGTTSVALVAQAMLDAEDYSDDPADINLTNIEANPDFNEVLSIVCSIIEAGGDPTESALVQQVVEDFLQPPTPTPNPTPTPVAVSSITITGEAKVSVELTAVLTPPGATATYQWQICATVDGTYTNILGAITNKYTPVADDVTKFIKVVATGTGGYSGTVTSAATAAVVKAPITAIGAITGTPQVGVELTAGALTPAGATAIYHWQYCDTVNGIYYWLLAYGTTYTPVADDVTKFIKVVATGTGGYSGTVTSAATAAVVKAPITAIGAITGTPQVGVELTAGALTPAAATASYQWQRSDTVDPTGTYTDITGIANKYTPVADDVTKFIKVVATGTGGYSGTVTSESDPRVAVVATGKLVIGDSYGGGKVAYFLQSGETIKDTGDVVLYSYETNVQHGLIAATADAPTQMLWSNIGDASVGTTGIEIGTGWRNTTLIVSQSGCTSGAAYYCDNLTEGGKDDWFLPSKNELNQLWINRVAIGGFAAEDYWSSSESESPTAALFQGFGGGTSSGAGKDVYSFRVRDVRYF
jgi:cytochrome c551/c552